MTIAEIHGKIGSSGGNLSDRLEDLLTSDVFGPLRYLHAQEGLFPILSEATPYCETTPKLEFDCSDEPEVCFWPWTGTSEPDVLIKCKDHLVMIEAKYLSGKSGGDDGNNSESAFSEFTLSESTSSDQLVREFNDLKRESEKYSKYSLIYLTAHRTFPTEDIGSSYDAITCKRKKEDYKNNVYWLSWFHVRKCIEILMEKQTNKHKKKILNDINRLLRKKGFRGFEGFSKIAIEKIYPFSDRIFYQHRGFKGFSEIGIKEVCSVSGSIFYQR